MTRSVIDPITRIEGHLRVEMEVTNGKVQEYNDKLYSLATESHPILV